MTLAYTNKIITDVLTGLISISHKHQNKLMVFLGDQKKKYLIVYEYEEQNQSVLNRI